MRRSEIIRKTKETDIKVSLDIDGKSMLNINTGIGFFDHMLESMGTHGFMDLDIQCKGDLHVDQHHSVEDIGIVLGKAIKEALGNKKGIKRFSAVYTPMDEALSMVAIDISGRSFLQYNVPLLNSCIGNFEISLVEEFFRAIANNAEITLLINLNYGKNTHHIIESVFKGFGRALNEATKHHEGIDQVISTKGTI